MSYAPPAPNAADFSWLGAPAYTPPAGSAADLSFVPPVVAGTVLVCTSRRAKWGSASALEHRLTARHSAAQQEALSAASAWAAGVSKDSTDRAEWAIASATDEAAHMPWGRYGGRAEPQGRAAWFHAKSSDERLHSAWGRYQAYLQPERVARWLRAAKTDLRDAAPWGGPMRSTDLMRHAVIARSVTGDAVVLVPWSKYPRVVQPGVGVSIPPDDGVPEALVVIPVRSVYMQVNAAFLRKVAGDELVPTFGMSLSLDIDSWVWSFNASLPASALSLVEPVAGEPVELEAFVNGTAFRLLVERITSERQFGRASIAISGRGKSAVLDAPYAPIINFSNDDARTVQQLMGDVLTVNGVSMGWTVNFGLDDWLVPAGVFSHRGSHMSALNEIAAAGGGYIQPHPTANEISVLKRYPVLPWLWATDVDPDIELPSAVVTRESVEWLDKPAYNRVYVSGQQAGVLGQITRAGTAGDMVAPTVTHALITHADAARQRGIPVLSDTGRIAMVGLRLPVLDAVDVITPGKFVRYVDGGTTRIGIVRSVSVEVGLPQIWQTIRLETHQ